MAKAATKTTLAECYALGFGRRRTLLPSVKQQAARAEFGPRLAAERPDLVPTWEALSSAKDVLQQLGTVLSDCVDLVDDHHWQLALDSKEEAYHQRSALESANKVLAIAPLVESLLAALAMPPEDEDEEEGPDLAVQEQGAPVEVADVAELGQREQAAQ
jgi:hypothetical protein